MSSLLEITASIVRHFARFVKFRGYLGGLSAVVGYTLSLFVIPMAKNPPLVIITTHEAVRDRSVVHYPKVDRWNNRDSDTGKFMDQKADEKLFKGVRKERYVGEGRWRT